MDRHLLESLWNVVFPLPAGSVFFPPGSGDSVEKAPESPIAAALFSGDF